MPDYTTDRRVLIEKTDENGVVFRDAIYMSEAEFATKTEADFQALADARYDAWKQATAPVVDTRSDAEIAQAEVDAYTAAKAEADAAAAFIEKQLVKSQSKLDLAVGIDVIEAGGLEAKP